MVGKIEASENIRSTLSLGDTDSFRLVDGIGDNLHGIYVDEFAGRRLISTSFP
jgi:23S rRNA G2069 N7-methylase RlmK/C1962 C5-methylase RlmI